MKWVKNNPTGYKLLDRAGVVLAYLTPQPGYWTLEIPRYAFHHEIPGKLDWTEIIKAANKIIKTKVEELMNETIRLRKEITQDLEII